jgi:hypothetical protein
MQSGRWRLGDTDSGTPAGRAIPGRGAQRVSRETTAGQRCRVRSQGGLRHSASEMQVCPILPVRQCLIGNDVREKLQGSAFSEK